MRIANRPPNIIRTFPKDFDFQGWEDYVFESVESGHQLCYYGRGIPRDVKPPAWLYIVHRGFVVAQHRIVDVDHYSPPICLPTWTGERMMTNGCIVCDGMMIPAQFPIPWRGFQGYRYCDELF